MTNRNKDRYTLVTAPSKFDLMLGTFDTKALTFRTEEGLSFDVYVHRLDVMADKGHDAWAIKGTFEETGRGNRGHHGECSLWFTMRTRRGKFQIVRSDPKFTIKGLEALTNDELLTEIEEEEQMARNFHDQFDKYSSTLNRHDRLVLQAYAAQLKTLVFGKSQINHVSHRALERGERIEDIYEP